MKQQLRRLMKERRAVFSAEERQQAARRCLELLLEQPRFYRAERLFCYAAYGTELPTALFEDLGKEIAYPKVTAAGEMEFYLGGRLEAGYRGIPEPIGGVRVVPRAEDIMLLPGLAFSEEGYRLGYGKGFYDRYLAACTNHPLCCGLGLEAQVLPKIPAEPHDKPLDWLVTEEKLRIFVNKC